MTVRDVDAVVVGSGPNGLAAAITIARAGFSVRVVEGYARPGGGVRTDELTLPGFRHDICSAIHPLVLASPFFRTIPLEDLGVEWVFPPAAVAHPLDDGYAVSLERSVSATAEQLGRDERAYRRLMQPLVDAADHIVPFVLAPPRPARAVAAIARFGLLALRSAEGLTRKKFEQDAARALVAGIASHSTLALHQSPSAGVALMLGILGHTVGWPFPRGGAEAIAAAMTAYLGRLGGEIESGRFVSSIAELPRAGVYLFDVAASSLLAIAGDRLPARYARRVARFRYGPGAFKVDWALDAPIPWKSEVCTRAATVHLGGTLEELADSESSALRGRVPDKPYVLLAQHSLFDDSRAPAGKHTAWAYCHVPNGSSADMTDAIEAQIERFAPGFKDVVLERSVRGPMDLEAYNPNLVGGDINSGLQDLRQQFARPVLSVNPYKTPADGIYLCSSSTPPGGGVHGMSGFLAAKSALARLRRREQSAT